MLLYISKINDPSENLARDEYFVRDFFYGESILHIYINNKCVVLGKNQSIYTELNLPYIAKNNIAIYRRLSGGGTVYQDLGNINISFITKFDNGNFNNYKHLIKPIIELLQKLGLNAYYTERNDIFIDDFKISGNAQFTTKNVILTHGTLLFDVDIKNLKSALQPMDINVDTYATKSVKSKVKNLKEYLPDYTLKKFLDDVINSFDKHYKLEILEKIDYNKIQDYIWNKYSKQEWNLLETPLAKINTKVLNQNKILDVKLITKNCKIVDLKILREDENYEKLYNLLVGKYYLPFDGTNIIIKDNQIIYDNS